ncbi:SPOR domain-containing protein, partial [Sphingomonas bacterium]|uniref:SPOR domain-containing protein n=1 Tax=Sphingomonas bacterium TaxID=1895847 RepID=UPI0015770C48
AEARAETAKAARDKQAATAKAARDRQAAEAKAALGRNPERHWVQLAGGANRATLPREWQALKARYGGALAGRSPWTMHYRYTNRLMIGPFASAAAAQDWVNDQRTKGITSFRVTTEAGTKVEPVDPE